MEAIVSAPTTDGDSPLDANAPLDRIPLESARTVRVRRSQIEETLADERAAGWASAEFVLPQQPSVAGPGMGGASSACRNATTAELSPSTASAPRCKL